MAFLNGSQSSIDKCFLQMFLTDVLFRLPVRSKQTFHPFLPQTCPLIVYIISGRFFSLFPTGPHRPSHVRLYGCCWWYGTLLGWNENQRLPEGNKCSRVLTSCRLALTGNSSSAPPAPSTQTANTSPPKPLAFPRASLATKVKLTTSPAIDSITASPASSSAPSSSWKVESAAFVVVLIPSASIIVILVRCCAPRRAPPDGSYKKRSKYSYSSSWPSS